VIDGVLAPEAPAPGAASFDDEGLPEAVD